MKYCPEAVTSSEMTFQQDHHCHFQFRCDLGVNKGCSVDFHYTKRAGFPTCELLSQTPLLPLSLGSTSLCAPWFLHIANLGSSPWAVRSSNSHFESMFHNGLLELHRLFFSTMFSLWTVFKCILKQWKSFPPHR